MQKYILMAKLQECKEWGISKGGECTSTEYKTNKHKMDWRCSKYHNS